MWTKLQLNQQWERMVGFTIPANDHVIVISYAALHFINLDEPASEWSDDRYPEGEGVYDYERRTLTYDDTVYHVLGLDGGNPIMRSADNEKLVIDADREVLTVENADGTVALEFHYADASGDWRYATFSLDYAYILLGVPYDLYAFRRQ